MSFCINFRIKTIKLDFRFNAIKNSQLEVFIVRIEKTLTLNENRNFMAIILHNDYIKYIIYYKF